MFPKVGSEGGWDAKSRYPTKQECLGDSFRGGGIEHNDFRPTGEAIHADE